MPPGLVAHVDMDAFYVSVELQRRPELRGLPVVVAGAGPRGVVTTASYEARRFGIGSATPAAWARRRCPDAVFLPPDFSLYRARSTEVMAVLRDHFELVEAVGLDEAYVDLRGLTRPRAATRRAKDAVGKRTGLGCSVGIGPNKLVAKVSSDADKPDGFLVLSQAEARDRFASSPPGIVPGIGPRTVERLAANGIETLGALAATSAADLARWFGARHGPTLARMARFEDDRAVAPARPAKSESRETTFPRDLSGAGALEGALRQLAEDLGEGLRAKRRRGRTIGIKVRLDDFSTHTRARTLAASTGDPAVIGRVAVDLLREFGPRRPVRLLGVRLAGLERDGPGTGGEPGGSTGEAGEPAQMALGM